MSEEQRFSWNVLAGLRLDYKREPRGARPAAEGPLCVLLGKYAHEKVIQIGGRYYQLQENQPL